MKKKGEMVGGRRKGAGETRQGERDGQCTEDCSPAAVGRLRGASEGVLCDSPSAGCPRPLAVGHAHNSKTNTS